MAFNINRSLLNPNFQGYKLASANSPLISTVALPAPPLSLADFELILQRDGQENQLTAISYAISSSKAHFNNLLALSKEACESEEERIVYLDHQMNLIFMTLQAYVESVYPLAPDCTRLASKFTSFTFPVLKSSKAFVACTDGLDSLHILDAKTQTAHFVYHHARPFVLKAFYFDDSKEEYQLVVYELQESPCVPGSSYHHRQQQQQQNTHQHQTPLPTTWFQCYLWVISLSSSVPQTQTPQITLLGQSTLAPSYVEFDGKEEWYMIFKAPFQWANQKHTHTPSPLLESWHQTSHQVTLMLQLPSPVHLEEIQVMCIENQCQIHANEHVLFEKTFGGSISKFDWVLLDQRLTLTVTKQSPNTHWSHCFQETSKWSLPGTETEEIDLETSSMYLYAYPSQRTFPTEQHAFLMNSYPSGFCTQYDIDGLVYTSQLHHTTTLHALGYIVPSKRDLRFCFCTEACAVLIEQEKHVFIYKPSLANEGQQFLVSFDGEVLGYAYSKTNNVTLLTTQCVYTFSLP